MLVENITFALDKMTVSYSGDESDLLSLTPEMVARLQAYWAKRLEEMAYKVMTGGFAPARELPALDASKYAQMTPNGNSPSRPQRGPWGVVCCPVS